MADIGQVLSLCATPALCKAAVTDLHSRRVPNVLPALAAGAGLAARVTGGDAALSLGIAAGVFGFLYLIWRMGWLGGGDVKLLTACVLLVPTGAVTAMLAAVALAGGLLGVAYLVLRKIAPTSPPPRAARLWSLRRLVRVEGWRIRRRGPLPYACAISAGCVFTMIAG